MSERAERERPRQQEEPAPEPQKPPPERTVLSAEEARQGEIILGKYGRWIWIGTFALIVLLVLVFGF